MGDLYIASYLHLHYDCGSLCICDANFNQKALLHERKIILFPEHETLKDQKCDYQRPSIPISLNDVIVPIALGDMIKVNWKRTYNVCLS